MIGLLLVVLGILFLSDSLHIFNFGHIISDWWPLILIGIGLFKLNKRERIGGIVIIIIGCMFLLSELNIVSWYHISRLWPLILIVIGAVMLLRRSSPKDGHSTDFSTNSSDKFELNALFSSLNQQVTSQQFKGGEVNAIFGNLSLDLRNSKLVPEGATLEANAVFGSVEIFISPGVQVDFRCSQFLGQARNTSATTQTGPVLTLTGDAVFGNIRVSN